MLAPHSLSFEYVSCTVSLVCLFLSHPSLPLFGYLLVTLPCRTRAAPGLQARTRSRASPSSRTRTRAGHVTIRPGYRLYTMGPAHAHASGSHLGPTAKLKSRPLRTSRRLAGLARTAQWDALLSRHDSLRPPASSGRTSRTNHDSTQPTCAQWFWSRSPRTGVAGPAPGPTAADPSGATRLALPPHHHSSCDRDKHTPRPPAASARFALLNHSHARPRHRNGPPLKGANDPSLLGHHSLGSVGDPPLQGHHALTHRGILRCSVQIRCQTNYISPSMRSQQVQVGPGR